MRYNERQSEPVVKKGKRKTKVDIPRKWKKSSKKKKKKT